MNEKDRIVDDLSLLFLPDLHLNTDSFKRDLDIDDFDNVPQESFNNFSNFLSNNLFISYKADGNNNNGQHQLTGSADPSTNNQQIGMNPFYQQQNFNQPISTLGSSHNLQQYSHSHIQPYDTMYQNSYPSHHHYANFVPVEATRQLTYNNHCYPTRNNDLNDQLMNFQDSKTPTPANEKSVKPPKKKAKTRKRDLKTMDFIINYNSKQLKRLLDLKKVPQVNNFTIVDKSNNPVSIGFNGFLNGKFLTNDHENCNYILTKNGGGMDQAQIDAIPKNQNPQVISCYRRNYIQISIDMNISGLHTSNNNKILRLQTSEYGYTITRVIKYFKLEIMAKTRSHKTTVPIFIKSSTSKKDGTATTTTKDRRSTPEEDNIVFSQIVKPEHIFLLDENIDQGAINKYFVIKKLQFKKATPNNGSLTFQNYYHLIVKLSAAVADLYYDDYVDDEFNNGLNGSNADNNEVTLAELISEPIIVRGRNPHFYAERKDVLIKGRSNTSKKSFQLASRDNVDEDDYADNDDDDVDDDNDDEENGGTGGSQVRDADEGEDGDEDGDAEEDPAPDDENEPEPDEDELAPNTNTTQQSPLAYNTTNQQIDLTGVNKYKYFPISKVYYLPPINVVYFPHGAHHNQTKEITPSQDDLHDQETRKRRTSSNVYFK